MQHGIAVHMHIQSGIDMYRLRRLRGIYYVVDLVNNFPYLA